MFNWWACGCVRGHFHYLIVKYRRVTRVANQQTDTQHTQSATSRRREQETTKHSELAHKYFHGGTKWPPEATNEWKCINLIFLLVCAPPLGPGRVARININIFRTANKEKKRESRDGHLIRAPHLHMNWSKHTRTQHKTSVALINQFAWIQTNYSKDGRHPQVPPGGLDVLKLIFFLEFFKVSLIEIKIIKIIKKKGERASEDGETRQDPDVLVSVRRNGRAMKKRGGAAGGRRSCRLIYESDAITRQTLDNHKNNADNGNNTKPREDRNYNKRPLSKTFYKEKLWK